MKKGWNKAKRNFKTKHGHLRTIPKSEFPALLKESIEALGDPTPYLQKAFQMVGFIPIDPIRVLKKLPEFQAAQEAHGHIACVVKEHLVKLTTPDPKKKKRNGFRCPTGVPITGNVKQPKMNRFQRIINPFGWERVGISWLGDL